MTAQSNVEKRPPQTPKLPPITGALALIAVIAAKCNRKHICQPMTSVPLPLVTINPSSFRSVVLDLCRKHTSYAPFAVRTISESFDAVPYFDRV